MPAPGLPTTPPPRRLAILGRQVAHLWQREIWRTAHLKDHSPRGWFYALLRVVSITWTVFNETRAASRAAALSFSSLLGLGPLVAISMLVAGLVLGQSNPNIAVNTLNQLIHFVAPQINQYEKLTGETAANRLAPALTPAPIVQPAAVAAPAGPAAPSVPPAASPALPPDAAAAPAVVVNPELVELINDFIDGARSGSAGTVGALSLILIVLLLFTSVEDAFNDIWGVRFGRSLLMRVMFYWTVLTLGAVLFFAAVTLLGAGAFVNVFFAKLPFGRNLLDLLRWLLPGFSFVLLVAVLTLFYRVIPNTRVAWRAAFLGAVVVAALLMLNNFVAFLYVRRVLLTKSLYGSLGILPVLMIGLYVFWIYVLIGGVISYAVQNVHLRNSRAAWGSLTESMRERLSLVVLLTIGRRFHGCLAPVTASQLSELLKVPTQILNECLNRLVGMQLVTTLRPASGSPATEHCYQPARPLNRMTLLEFKTLDDNLGDDPFGQTIEHIDPILRHYDAGLGHLADQELFQKTLEQLFADYPFDESRPPFSLGERPPRFEA